MYMYKLLEMFICMVKITFMSQFTIALHLFMPLFGYQTTVRIIQLGLGTIIQVITTAGIHIPYLDIETTFTLV